MRLLSTVLLSWVEEAEELTNIYYIKAFADLSTAELEEHNGLLERLAAELAPKADEEG